MEIFGLIEKLLKDQDLDVFFSFSLIERVAIQIKLAHDKVELFFIFLFLSR